MRPLGILLLTCLLFSCSKRPETYINYLNGYWEIDEVTLQDGSKRDYGFNDTVDFIEISDSLTGFRKKLKPNFDGSFSTSVDAETVKVVIENDSVNLYYKTPYDEWKETVIEASETKLIIQNQKNLRYTYKRYEPITME